MRGLGDGDGGMGEWGLSDLHTPILTCSYYVFSISGSIPPQRTYRLCVVYLLGYYNRYVIIECCADIYLVVNLSLIIYLRPTYLGSTMQKLD